MGKPKAEKRNGKKQWKVQAKKEKKERKCLKRLMRHGQRQNSKIVLDYASGGGVVDVQQRKCEITIDKGPFSDVICHEANSGGRIVKRGQENKLLVKDKTSPESTFRETSYADTTRKTEIRQAYASKGGVIDFRRSNIRSTITVQNADVTLTEAKDRGKVNFDGATYTSNVKLGPGSKYVDFVAEAGVITGKDFTFVPNVTQCSSTGNAADRASSSSGIPSATDTPTTESSGKSCSGTPGGKIRVKLKSIAKGVTNPKGVFEPDDKVGDKMEEIKKMLGEEGEICLFHEDGKEIYNSKSVRENEIKDGDTIVVKAEVLCATGAYENKTRQTA